MVGRKSIRIIHVCRIRISRSKIERVQVGKKFSCFDRGDARAEERRGHGG